MKLRANRLLALASLAVLSILAMFTTATTAHAAVRTCTPYSINTGYPADGGTHSFYCDGSQGSILADANTLYNALSGPDMPSTVRSKLLAGNAKYYFFQDRTDANDTLSSLYGNAYKDTTARCGFTKRSMLGQLVVAVFRQCTINGAQVTNPSLARTGFHETGHAFAAAFTVVDVFRTAPDRTTGFQFLHTNDRTSVTPPGDANGVGKWSTWNATQQQQYICDLFGSTVRSPLEQDLGETDAGAVCTSGTVNPAYRSGTTFHTPSQIANNDGHVTSYFIGQGNYTETWAEEFVVAIFGRNSPANFLPNSDYFLGQGSNPPPGSVSGVPVRRAFNCTRLVVEKYIATGDKPTTADLAAVGCPQRTDL